MDLRITTRQGLIGINTTQGKMNINYGKTKYYLQVKHPKIDMEVTQPKVKINQEKPLAEMGLKDVFTLTRSKVQEAKQACLNGIGKIARQGDELARIEAGGNPIPEQAEYNAFEQFMKEVNFDLIPKSRPEITLEEGKVYTNLEEGKLEVLGKPQEVNLNFSRGKIEIYLRQKPFIDVEYIGNNLDMII